MCLNTTKETKQVLVPVDKWLYEDSGDVIYAVVQCYMDGFLPEVYNAI
jgi:hypothetical protein